VLPLALFLGLLLAIGRLYAESEMAVLASVGIGPQRLWKPLASGRRAGDAGGRLASLWLAPCPRNEPRK
jgi:lipopolysaccharide export system permease protein